jgi:hypothetical protein
MKNIFKIISVILIAFSCKAQSPIIDLKTFDGYPTQDLYCMDMYDVLAPFEGTYIYTNGSTSLTVQLEKRTMAYDGYMYEDLLVGEYRYVENGIEKINTLTELINYYDVEQRHSIGANLPQQMGDYLCIGCVANEKRIVGGLSEDSTTNSAQIILGRTTVGSQQALTLNLWWRMTSHPEGSPLSVQPTFPGGDYILIKQ